MKSIKFFFACVLALTFVACSNAESDSFEDNTSHFESMKSLYGIESVSYTHLDVYKRQRLLSYRCLEGPRIEKLHSRLQHYYHKCLLYMLRMLLWMQSQANR